MRQFLIAISLSLIFVGSANAKQHCIRHESTIISDKKSYLIADINGNILKEKSSNTVRPIASLSKLLLALLVSEQNPNESLSIPINRSVHSSIPFNTESLSRKELLTLTLVKSDNFAAQILCENLPDCVNQMNAKALELGMTNTHYSEPTGLSSENVSTAQDLLKLVIAAVDQPIITELSSMPSAEIIIGKKKLKINNTNPLTSKFNIMLSKTGFTLPAGGCMAIVVQSNIGSRIFILLGSRNVKTRVPDMENLVKGI